MTVREFYNAVERDSNQFSLSVYNETGDILCFIAGNTSLPAEVAELEVVGLSSSDRGSYSVKAQSLNWGGTRITKTFSSMFRAPMKS